MQYALLWYSIYSNILKSHGFMVNPYERFIENINIKGKQFTISWYVDDNKVSHIDEELSTQVLETISENFGNLTVSRRNKHISLGMEI